MKADLSFRILLLSFNYKTFLARKFKYLIFKNDALILLMRNYVQVKQSQNYHFNSDFLSSLTQFCFCKMEQQSEQGLNSNLFMTIDKSFKWIFLSRFFSEIAEPKPNRDQTIQGTKSLISKSHRTFSKKYLYLDTYQTCARYLQKVSR